MRLSLALILILCGCQESPTSPPGKRAKNTWTCIDLRQGNGKAADEAWGACAPGFEKCIASIMERRQSEKAEMVRRGMPTIGFSPILRLNHRVILIGSDNSVPTIVVASCDEDGVAHSIQNNLVLVGIVKEKNVLLQEVLEHRDMYIIERGITLWSRVDNMAYRLFLGTVGPTFQGMAPLHIDAWDIRIGQGGRKLFAAIGPESTIDDSFDLNLTAKDDAIVGTIRLGALSEQSVVRNEHIEVLYKGEGVVSSAVAPTIVSLEISE